MVIQRIICLKRGCVQEEKQIRKKKSEEEKSVGKRKKEANTRRETWEREARKAKKAGNKEKNSFFIHNVSTTYCVYIQYLWEYALFRKTIVRNF